MGHIVGFPASRSFVGGGDTGPELIPDLELWLNANTITGLNDGDEITTWDDDSGNGRHATGSVGGGAIKPRYRPTAGPNTMPAVQISDEATPTSSFFSLADNSFSGLTEGHIFVVVKIDQDPPDSNLEAGPPTSFGQNKTDLYPFVTDSKVYDGFASTVRKDAIDISTSLATWHVYEARSASGAWSLRVNGATSGGDFFSTATNTVGYASTNLRVGSQVTTVNTLNGHIAEIILYGRVLGAGEITDIYDYLEAKYAITMP